MTTIEWTDLTINPQVGCSVPTLLDGTPSPECLNCYAKAGANSARLQQFKQYQGVEKWDGTINFVPDQLLKILSLRSPKKIFLCSMSDMFHENVPDEWIDEIMATCYLRKHHTYQILTKRTKRMVEYFISDKLPQRWIATLKENYSDYIDLTPLVILSLYRQPHGHLWLGTTTGCQASADERIPLLAELTKSGWTTFVSAEPLLERVDLRLDKYPVSQVITGAESGRNARTMNHDDVRYLRDQCVAHGVPFFYKQDFVRGKKVSLPILDGRQWAEFPKN